MTPSRARESWWPRFTDRLVATAPARLEPRLRDAYATLTPLRQVRMPLARLHGVTRRSGREASVVVAGPLRWSRYLAERLFAGAAAGGVVDHVAIWALARRLRSLQPSADLTIARLDRVSAGWLLGDDYLRVPEWVGAWLPLPVDFARLARQSKSVAEDMRRVRCGSFTVDVSHADADFDAFYHRMYVPYMLRRHGAEAYVHGWHGLRRAFRSGGLLRAHANGRPVAGDLFEHRGSTLALAAIGVADGDEAWRRRGAISALYVHVIQYAMRSGCTAIDLRGVRPSLTDGLLRYKAKWGCELYTKADGHCRWLVHWNRLDGAVAELLADVPLVFHDRGGLSGVAHVTQPSACTAADIREIHRRLWVPGLRRLALVGAHIGHEHSPPPDGIRLIDAAAVRDGGPRALLAALDGA